MRFLRYLVASLVLTLLMGQQAVVLHDLGHALEKHSGAPAEQTCDKHYLCAALGSAVGTSMPLLAAADPPSLPVLSRPSQGAAQRTRFAYRSQAPPAAL